MHSHSLLVPVVCYISQRRIKVFLRHFLHAGFSPAILRSLQKVSASMRNLTRISLALGTSTALLGLAAFPAAADSEAGSSATIQVEGGSLHISAQPATDPKSLKPGTTAEFVIPVEVTDERAGEVEWNVSVTVDDFKLTGREVEVIPAAGATYTPSQPAVTAGVATLVAAQTVPLERDSAAGPAPTNRASGVVGATQVHGNNTAAWKAQLSIPVPGSALQGDYTTVVTHSVL